MESDEIAQLKEISLKLDILIEKSNFNYWHALYGFIIVLLYGTLKLQEYCYTGQVSYADRG